MNHWLTRGNKKNKPNYCTNELFWKLLDGRQNHQPEMEVRQNEVWVSHHFPGGTYVAVGWGQRLAPRVDGAHRPCRCCFRLTSHAVSLRKELFGLVLSGAGEPANTKTDPVLSASVDIVITCHLSEVCEKAVLARLYSKILQNSWMY